MCDDAPNEKHAAFAREVVALARKHGMDALSFSFRAGFGLRFPPGGKIIDTYSGMVNVSWSEGRHGDRNNINLRFEGGMTISEMPSDKATATSFDPPLRSSE